MWTSSRSITTNGRHMTGGASSISLGKVRSVSRGAPMDGLQREMQANALTTLAKSKTVKRREEEAAKKRGAAAGKKKTAADLGSMFADDDDDKPAVSTTRGPRPAKKRKPSASMRIHKPMLDMHESDSGDDFMSPKKPYAARVALHDASPLRKSPRINRRNAARERNSFAATGLLERLAPDSPPIPRMGGARGSVPIQMAPASSGVSSRHSSKLSLDHIMNHQPIPKPETRGGLPDLRGGHLDFAIGMPDVKRSLKSSNEVSLRSLRESGDTDERHVSKGGLKGNACLATNQPKPQSRLKRQTRTAKRGRPEPIESSDTDDDNDSLSGDSDFSPNGKARGCRKARQPPASSSVKQSPGAKPGRRPVARSQFAKRGRDSTSSGDERCDGDETDAVCSLPTQESGCVDSQGLKIKVQAIVNPKARKRQGTGPKQWPAYLRKRLSSEELSTLRLAFVKHYPPPPSNMQAQGRYEQKYGTEMSTQMIKGLWEKELKPWSDRWWALYQEFNDEARAKKLVKKPSVDPTIVSREAEKWAATFYKANGDARQTDFLNPQRAGASSA